MKIKLKSIKRSVLLGTIILVSCLLITIITPVSAKETYYNNIEWLRNNGFDNSSLWVLGISGDDTDVDASIMGGEATFSVIGDNGEYSYVANPPLDENWNATQNPEFPIIPDIYGINETGAFVQHEYKENPVLNTFGVMGNQTRNFPSMNWKQNVTVPVESMEDYIITSASISALVNGTADTNLETLFDTLPAGGYLGVGDFARFYIKVSDPNGIETYQIAYNRTLDLGIGYQPNPPDNYGLYSYMADTNMSVIDEDLLILYLTKVLEYDNQNFTIILGIDVYCEDNYPTYDRDTFYELRIKSFNLTFTYEKRINQFSTISWSQTGDKIPDNAQILNASMNFEYKINNTWPVASPNSELQALVNGKEYVEKVDLPSFSTVIQQMEFNGTTLKNLLATDVNITVLLRLYLADEFKFTETVKISIDNVSFKISYLIITQDPPSPNYLWLTAGLGSGLAVLSVVFIAYQTIFKYPVFVRKIRSIRRIIRKGLKSGPLKVLTRSEQVNSLSKTSLNLEGFPERS